jgi:hypothetical protein
MAGCRPCLRRPIKSGRQTSGLQQRGLVDFQVRIMEDLDPPSFSLVVIDDPVTADRPQRAPLSMVTYH